MASMNDVYKVGGGVLFGAAIGAAVGMLFAPKSGKETREAIAAKASEAQEKTQEMIEQTRERVEQIYDQGREMVTEKREWAAEALHSGKEALMGLRDDTEKEAKVVAKAASTRVKKLKTQVAG
jgi:gas vesicle protein